MDNFLGGLTNNKSSCIDAWKTQTFGETGKLAIENRSRPEHSVRQDSQT